MEGKELLTRVPRILFAILGAVVGFLLASIPCAYMVWVGVQARGPGGVIPETDFMMIMITLMSVTLMGGLVGYESWPGLCKKAQVLVGRFR